MTLVLYKQNGTTYSARFPELLTRDQVLQRLLMQHHRYVKPWEILSITRGNVQPVDLQAVAASILFR